MKKIIIVILTLVLIIGGIFFAVGKIRQDNEPQQALIVAKAKNYGTLVAGGKLLHFTNVRNLAKGVRVIVSRVGQDKHGVYAEIMPTELDLTHSVAVRKKTQLYLGQSVPVYTFPKNADDKSPVKKVGTVSLAALGKYDGGQTVTLALKVNESGK